MSAARLGLAAWAGLVLLHGAWLFWIEPPSAPLVLIASLRIGPLLLPLLVLHRDARRARLWVGILALFYFCHGVMEAYAEPAVRLAALGEIGLCLVAIGTLGWEARHYRRRRA